MRSLLKLLLICWFLVDVWSKDLTSISSTDYVNLRLKETKDLLLSKGKYDSIRRKESSLGTWKNVWRRAINSQERASTLASARLVNIFDEMFMIDERQVLSVVLNLDEANNPAKEHQLNLASPNQPIKFIKSYFQNDLALLLVCQATCCSHYRVTTNDWTIQHRQIIQYPSLIPIDAVFFTHEGKTQLVIAYDFDYDYSIANLQEPTSKIHQWNGTQMLCIHHLGVSKPTSVHTFRDGLHTTFLLFTVRPNAVIADATIDTTCVIYQLNDKNEIRRMNFFSLTDVLAIHPYNYANQALFLTVNHDGKAQILTWNAAGFDKLMDLPDIQADQARIVQIENETLLFTSDQNALRVYRLEMIKVRHLADLAVLNGQRIIETTAWKHQDNIMLLLVKINADGTFQTELWQLNLPFETSGVEDNYTRLWACLRELKDTLDSRELALENFQIAQLPRDLFNSNKSGKSFPLHIVDLKINTGNVSVVQFRKQNNHSATVDPRQIKRKLAKLKDQTRLLQQNMTKNLISLRGYVSVDNEVEFEELHVDELEAKYINGQSADFQNYLISGIDQQFPVALSLKNLSIDDLNVGSLCGYAFDHWMRVNDSARSNIGHFSNINGSSIINDHTIVIESSDLIMNKLNTPSINGIDLRDFLQTVFILGREQAIEGSVRYESTVRVNRLYSDKLNNVSSCDLISKPSNQSLNDVFIDSLQVEQLYVQKINGVPINAAARMSQENVIKGKLTLAKLVITDELNVNENIAIPLTHSTQVYDQIHIDGDVFLKNLDIDDYAQMNLGNEALASGIRAFVASSWSKSSYQIIEAPVSLLKGASIDRLVCPYLNGLSEHDFLYSDSNELVDLENVTFANFHFNNVAGISEPSIVEETDDRLIFGSTIHMKNLSVKNLLSDKYNGIPISSIMQPSEALQLPEKFEFETVRVDGEINVDDLRINRLNSKSSEAFGKALRTDQRLKLDLLDAKKLRIAKSLHVSKLNGEDLEKALSSLEQLETNSSTMQVRVEGEVIIEEGMQVAKINDKEADDYVNRMRQADPASLLHIESLVNLTISEELEVGLLNGHKVEQIFAESLSKTKQQTLDGQVAFIDAQLHYLTADMINNVQLSKLIYVDQPAVLHGNVSFFNLYVDGDVRSQTFNAQNTSKLERKLHRPVASNSIANLLVQADVKWDEPSSNLRASLAHLLDNAVTRHEHQIIDAAITFRKPLVVESLYLRDKQNYEISRQITRIISDMVLDDDTSGPIIVRGTKIFKESMIADNLEVHDNIDINNVNGIDFREFSLQIYQKDQAESISSQITFLESVEIGRLISTQTHIHGVALQQLAIVGQKMPKKLQFQHLLVNGNVSLDKLDGIVFDDFVKRRVTLDEDNEIFIDVEFVQTVRVFNGSFVAKLNGVEPENLVENNADALPIMLHGNKIFFSNLLLKKNLETTRINDFLVNSIFENAVFNNTNSDILGSLVFEESIEISGNMSVTGEINGIKLENAGLTSDQLMRNVVDKETSLLSKSLGEIDKETRTLDSTLLYLEEESKLNWHFAGVQSIRSLAMKNKTRLEIEIAEDVEVCGLPKDCMCRKQYIVDVSPFGDYVIIEQKSTNLSNSFYSSEWPYGIKIVSRSASYSEQCSKSNDAHEYTKIFWFKFDGNREILRRTPAFVINGYISDSQTFLLDDKLYLIVAIFYNKETKSHATDCLLYQFDLSVGKASLIQRIATNGAKSVRVFDIPKVGLHVLIGCVKARAESLLLRFDPISQQLRMMRTFATGGSKHVASVNSNDKTFVILSNPDVRAIQIFNYEYHSDNFADYQILFFESRVTSIAVFYTGDFAQSDAFVVTTTKNGWLYIYEYMFYGKFQLKLSYWADDIHILTPFRHMNKNYLFAALKFNSTVYKVIQQGYSSQ